MPRTGNVALVARRHEILSSTIHTWIKKQRQRGSIKTLSKAKDARYKAMEKQLKEVSTEADRVAIAKRWIKKGDNASTVLNSVGLAASTYYYNIAKENKDNKTPTKNRLGAKYRDFH